MAAKKPKAPKKFKQARTAAKADAKAAFNGKVQARRKDITGKLTAEDKQVLREVSKESRAGIITGPDGKPINVGKSAETAAERFDREGRQAREKFRAQMREEGLYPPEKGATPSTPKSAVKAAPAKPKTSKPTVAKTAAKPAAKPAVKTAAPTKGYAAGKELNAAGKARYDELIKQGVKPKSALNKALFAQAKADGKPAAKAAEAPAKTNKPSTTKTKLAKADKVSLTRPTDASLTANEDAYLKKTQERLIKEGKLSGSKEVAIRPKAGAVESTRAKVTPVASVTEKAKKFGKTKKFVKGAVLTSIAAEAVSAVKGSTEKDFKEIQRLENKLAALKGQKPKYTNMGSNKNPISSAKGDLANLASLASFGLVGKTRRERMDELNSKITKAQAKKDKATTAAAKPSVKPASSVNASGNRVISPSHMSSSKANINIAAGGSTSKATQGSTYSVTKGDTLSGIAKAAGVSLSDIHAANPIFKKNAKYKQGNMIWSGTKVKIPTIKK